METGSALCGEPVTLPGHLSGLVCCLSGSSLGWDRQAGAQTWRRGLGRVRRMHERQMNWCMQIYVRSGGRYYWDFKAHMILTQNVAAGRGLLVTDEWKNMTFTVFYWIYYRMLLF